jgi:hypothetical protein
VSCEDIEELLRRGQGAEWLRKETSRRAMKKAAATKKRWKAMRNKPLGSFADVDRPPDPPDP